jgi:hypothetical protein
LLLFDNHLLLLLLLLLLVLFLLVFFFVFFLLVLRGLLRQFCTSDATKHFPSGYVAVVRSSRLRGGGGRRQRSVVLNSRKHHHHHHHHHHHLDCRISTIGKEMEKANVALKERETQAMERSCSSYTVWRLWC